MNFRLSSASLAAATLFLASGALHAQAPNAEAILEGARLSATLTTLDEGLEGRLNRRTPIALFLKGENIQFQFSENGSPWRVFHMRLSDKAYDLFEIVDGKTNKFPPNKLVEPIAGTDLTYEDLAFRFFYWPNPKLEGEEKVNGQNCYKLRLDKPKGSAGRYEVVYVWVHTKFGAFMRIRGHDRAGNLVKEFQVEDIMQISKDVWTLKKMQVASYANGRRTSITDVTFDTPKKVRPKGLR